MNIIKRSNCKILIVQITLIIFILLQTISQLHLHLDEHNHENEHQCVICHISVNSVIPNIDLNLISIISGILLVVLNYFFVLNKNNYKYSFTSRSPPLL